MKRDFTEATKTEFINLVQEVNESEWLKKKNPLDNVDDLLTFDVQFPWNTLEDYYRKMIDKNDMTVGKINEIWENVQILDATYQSRFLALNELAVAYKEKLRILCDKIKPENIVNTLNGNTDELKNTFVKINDKILEKLGQYELSKILIVNEDSEIIEYNLKYLQTLEVKKLTCNEYKILCDLEKKLKEDKENYLNEIIDLTEILGNYERYQIFGEDETISDLYEEYNFVPSRVEIYKVEDNNIEFYEGIKGRFNYLPLNALKRYIDKIISEVKVVGDLYDVYKETKGQAPSCIEGIKSLNKGDIVYVDEMFFTGKGMEDVLIRVMRIQIRDKHGNIVGEAISNISKTYM